MDTFEPVKQALAAAKIDTTLAELKYLADNEVEADAETAKKVLDLIEKRDDHDDVTAVHSSLKYTDKVIALMRA